MPHRTPADTAAATQKTDKHTPVPRRTTGNRTENTPAQRRKNTVHTKKITTGGTPQANALKKTKNRQKNEHRIPETPERRAESEKRHTQNKKHHGKKIPHTLITRKNVLRKTLSCNIFVINSIKIYYDGRRITTTKNQNKQPNQPPAIKSAKPPHRSPLPAPRSPPTGKPSHP